MDSTPINRIAGQETKLAKTKAELAIQPHKPPKVQAKIDHIPQEIKLINRWVTWDWARDEKRKKWTKPPLCCDGSHASTIDPKTWTTFERANRYGMIRSGIGFVLGNEIGIVGVDLDDCRDPETGEINALQAELIKRLDSYAEVSPSGTGVKLLCRAVLPEKCKKANHDIGIEIYSDRRYFTITGELLAGAPLTINPRQVVIDELISNWMAFDSAELPRPISNSPADEIELAKSALEAISASRAEGYTDWLQIGMALHSLSPSLLFDWDAWSAKSAKYTPGDCARKWESFGKSDGRGSLNIGSLYHFAKLDGWKPPRGWKAATKQAAASARKEATAEALAQETRKQITISDNELTMVNEVVGAMSAEPNLFVRADKLIEVYDSPSVTASGSQDTTIAMRSIPPDKLRTVISGLCVFVRDDEDELAVVRIPSNIPQQVYHHAHYPGIRSLAGVSEWPFMRPDGTFCMESGYDQATKTILRCSCKLTKFNPNPTRQDAEEACDRLSRIVSDFEFEHPNHKAAWLAALLTMVARPAINGPVPLFLIDASVWGSGKSKLASLIGIICSGRPMPVTAWPSKDEEVSKSLASMIVEGRPWVCWDNAKTVIGGQALEAILTSTSFNGRILGQTKTTSEIPVRLVQFVTGNNASVTDDTARRTCHIRISPQSESPDMRTDFKHADIDQYVSDNREQFLTDACTVLRAWMIAKQNGETVQTSPWGSYERWAGIVRDALCWIGWGDVRDTSGELKSDTASSDPLADVIAGLLEAKMPVSGWTSKEIFEASISKQFDYHEKRDKYLNENLNRAIRDVFGERDISNVKLGKFLHKNRGRIINGFRFTCVKDLHTKKMIWKLIDVSANSAGYATPTLTAFSESEPNSTEGQ